MGYRGEDLDLRTPQTWSATPGDLASVNEPAPMLNGQRAPYRSGPIWVDETVLACSNHAFDVALAHRAGDVRLEHLLHALTRIDAAAEALEARGVRVAALRRESATIIASEIPVGLPNGKGTPRRSEDFAEVLRLAAANAARRNAPAGIEDLLYVLFEHRADMPGLSLLSRHTMRSVRETSEPLPPLTRYVADTHRYASPRPQSTPAVEPPRAFRPETSSSVVDQMQTSRIEALEQMVRGLGNDLAQERQVVSGLLKDLNRETLATRDEHGRLQTGLYDRLNMLEQAVVQTRGGTGNGEGFVDRLQAIEDGLDRRLSDMSGAWSVLSDRLQALEGAVREPRSVAAPKDLADSLRNAFDLTPISNRLDIIEEALLSSDTRGIDELSERVKSLQADITRALAANAQNAGRFEQLVTTVGQRGDITGALVPAIVERVQTAIANPLIERVHAIANGATSQQAELRTALTKFDERMSGVEGAITAEIETAAAKHQAYAQDLTEVHDALMKLNQNQHTLAGSIDQWRSDAAGDIAVISNRLATLDADNERPIETLNALTTHMDTMNRMMIERYHRRNRFWYWLFGTDDWIGASWPSQAAVMEAERQKLAAAASPKRD
ncbi:MAG: Clp protease N-terminal domain-containing protein [Hyphomicrobium sp.]